MAKLPAISGAKTVREFEKTEWRQDRQRGSHVVMLIPDLNVSLSVPQHREIAPGTLRAMIRFADMTVDEFVTLL